MYEMDKEKFGVFISKLRKEKGWTQKELAERLFLSDKAISKWERGLSIPDVTVLIPLAECLGVTVTELLECERMEQAETMSADRVDALVQRTIFLSAEEKEQRQQRKKRWSWVYLLSIFAGLLEIGVIWLMGMPIEDMVLSLLTAELLASIFGFYFCFFMKEQLPTYYDENKISSFSDGVFRMNVPGVSLHNGNWPHIVQALRIWSAVCIAGYPVIVLLAYLIFPKAGTYLCFLQLPVALSLFLPVYVVGKRYKRQS